MKARRVAVAAAILGLAAGEFQAQKQIRLRATVSSPGGEPVATIDPNDVRVFENDVRATVVKVEGFTRASKVQVLVDNGIGMPAANISDLRKGLAGLLEAIPANVETTVVTTAPQPRFIERGTTDKAKLMKAVDLVAPDSGPGRFVESLEEATQRVEREQDSFHTIVTVGTSAGDLQVRDADLERLSERSRSGRVRVFAVLLAVGVNVTLSGGDIQSRVAEMVAGNSGGRFEAINAPGRLATLLPEIGAEIAKSMAPSTRQFRFTVERPAGMTGDLGRLRVGMAGGLLVSGVTVE